MVALALAAGYFSGCADDQGIQPGGRPAPRPLLDSIAPAGFPSGGATATAPASNPLTEAGAQLGKRLFFDKRLSRTNEISCGSCHQQKFAFSDPAAVSTGIEGHKGTRNAPALVNLAWGESFFWDGRAKTLEDQVGQPIENPVEMDLKLAEAVQRIGAEPSYGPAFQAAFGGPASEEFLRRALASFVRTLVSGQSPYDRFLRGDKSALAAAEQHGLALFFGDGGECFHCHPPNTLTNEGYFNNGSFDEGGDAGRKLLTGRTGDLGKFKVPGLRNVAASAPYMHDGSVATLEKVVAQYANGGRGHVSADPLISPLKLSERDQADLVAFLRALTDAEFLGDPRFAP